MGEHLIDGEFQSDKYPTCPRGKVPLSVKDPTAQDLLWEYAQRRRSVDPEFSADLEDALLSAGYAPTAAEVVRRINADPSLAFTAVDASPDIALRARQVGLTERPPIVKGDRVRVIGDVGLSGWGGAVAIVEHIYPVDGRPNLECVATVKSVGNLGVSTFAVKHLERLPVQTNLARTAALVEAFEDVFQEPAIVLTDEAPPHFAQLRAIAEVLRGRGDCGCTVVLADGSRATLRIEEASR